MNSSPLVTVVTSLYNYGKFIQDSAGSVLAQTYPNVQLIVVDNGSTDDSAEKLAAIEDPRIEKYRFEKNQGISRALNFGYSHAKGDWVTFLPADDRMRPNYIERMVATGIERNLDIVGCWQRVIDGEGQPNEKYAPLYEGANNLESFDLLDFRRLRWENPLNHPLFLWKRTLADQCMPMQEGVIPCDWGMFLRASRAGARLEIMHEKLLDYRVHGNNLGFRTPSQEYMFHFMYLHLTEYRLTAQKMAEDPAAELRLCHEELVPRVARDLQAPAAVQAKIVMASETGTGSLDRWPDIESFKDYLLGPAPADDPHFKSLEALFTYGLARQEEHKAVQDELDRSKQRGQRLREELDTAKANVERFKGKLDAQSKQKKPRLKRWMEKVFGPRTHS